MALLGASGCGKSTLLQVLTGLDSEIGGDVQVARRRAVALQQPRLLPWKKVWRNVVLGPSPEQDRDGARAALAEVGLGERIDDWPKTLSGGEAQRAAPARALVRDPDLGMDAIVIRRAGRAIRHPGPRKGDVRTATSSRRRARPSAAPSPTPPRSGRPATAASPPTAH